MSNLIIGGLPNLMTFPDALASFAASSEWSSTTTPDDYLLDQEPSRKWRSLWNAPYQTYIDWVGNAERFSWDHIALVGTNLNPSSARIRLAVTGDPLAALTASSGIMSKPQMKPTGTVAESNTLRSGGGAATFADSDQGTNAASPFSTYWEPSTKTSTAYLHLSFDTNFGGSPRTGGAEGGYQTFAVFARAVGEGGRMQIALYDGGVLQSSSVTKYVRNTTGACYLLHWDASDLVTSDGSGVEVRVTLYNDTASASDYIQVGAIDWMNEVDGFSGMDPNSLDTGWLALDQPPTGGLEEIMPQDWPFTNFFHAPAVLPDTEFIRFRLMIEDDGDKNWLVPEAVPGYVEAGVIVLGDGFSPATNRDFGALVGVKDLSFKNRTHGGQTYGSKRARLRCAELPMPWLTAAEAQTLYDRLLWRKGILDPVLISTIPGDATEGFHTTFYATVEGEENWINAPFYDIRQMNLKFVEKR